MTQRFLLSIIIVHLDEINELIKTLESICLTKSLEVEVIIQDGGTKNINEIIRKSNFKNVKLISKPDKGIYDAMNKGVNNSSGLFVLFLNSGDTFFNSSSLQQLLLKIKDDISKLANWDVLVWKVCVDQNQNKIKFGIMDSNTVEAVFSHQGVIVKRCLLENYNFDEKYLLSADYKFFKQCFYDKKKFNYYKQIITNVTSGGISDIKRMQVVKEWWLINSEFGFNFKTLLKFCFVYFKTLVSTVRQICKKL